MKIQHYLIAVATVALGATACGEAAEATDEAVDNTSELANESVATITDAFNTEPYAGANYGAGVSTSTDVWSFADFMDKMSTRDSIEQLVIQGEVLEVCQKKGCWMTIANEEGKASEVTVRFKDYGFFMPKTLSGHEVAIEGSAKRTLVPVADLRHYAEDAGKSSEEIAAITEPKEELEIIATGVRVL